MEGGSEYERGGLSIFDNGTNMRSHARNAAHIRAKIVAIRSREYTATTETYQTQSACPPPVS
jgi:hypothetical protein